MSKKRVLVTGAGGFLGSALCRRLQSSEWAGEILAPDRQTYDLRDSAQCAAMYRDLRPDIVLHAAGRTGGTRMVAEHPADYFYDNVLMDSVTFHEAHRAGVEKFLAIGTVCSYPGNAPVPLCEDALWDGYPEESTASYGMAKRMILAQARAYQQQYGFLSVHPVLINVYGPGDHFSPENARVVPALVHKFLSAARDHSPFVSLWGDGSLEREFLYVDDAADSILRMVEVCESCDPVNIGSGQEVTIKQLATVIAAETGYTGEIQWDASASSGQLRRSVDTTRMTHILGEQQRLPFEEGIRRTVAWYRNTP